MKHIRKKIDWQANRILSKLNYVVHTDAVKTYIVPTLTEEQKKFVYAEEADVLNVALFGMTAKEWREQNKDEKGNIRDTANVKELVCLANMESLNAHFINEGLSQKDRLQKLNKIAIEQMKILSREYVRKLEKVR